ncbi:hypothetical protein [Bradyrhizobium sp. AZCC 2230]|uniref:hypothetical protein n=1 Tax=Bradyrhizobium sp. AZCC 2230 TaxID=3117021 RepID=UPI002FF3F871
MNERDFEQQLKDDGFQEIEYQKLDPRSGKGRHRHHFEIRGLVISSCVSRIVAALPASSTRRS